MDLLKALLIGIALTAGFIAIPVVIAVLLPVLVFVTVVGTAYLLLKLLQFEDTDDDKPP